MNAFSEDGKSSKDVPIGVRKMKNWLIVCLLHRPILF